MEQLLKNMQANRTASKEKKYVNVNLPKQISQWTPNKVDRPDRPDHNRPFGRFEYELSEYQTDEK